MAKRDIDRSTPWARAGLSKSVWERQVRSHVLWATTIAFRNSDTDPAKLAAFLIKPAGTRNVGATGHAMRKAARHLAEQGDDALSDWAMTVAEAADRLEARDDDDTTYQTPPLAGSSADVPGPRVGGTAPDERFSRI